MKQKTGQIDSVQVLVGLNIIVSNGQQNTTEMSKDSGIFNKKFQQYAIIKIAGAPDEKYINSFSVRVMVEEMRYMLCYGARAERFKDGSEKAALLLVK